MTQDIHIIKETINYIVFQDYSGKYNYSYETKLITFDKNMQFYVSSVIPEFIQYLIQTGILTNQELRLWNQLVKIESIEIMKEPQIEEKCQVYTLSPITVYSTFQNQFRKKTYYYSPTEPDFYELIKQNMIKKYIAFYGKEPQNTEFEMSNIENKYKEKIILYKNNYVIKAYDGKFNIKGNPELIQLAYQTGLSAKNAQGFGMIELEERRD